MCFPHSFCFPEAPVLIAPRRSKWLQVVQVGIRAQVLQRHRVEQTTEVSDFTIVSLARQLLLREMFPCLQEQQKQNHVPWIWLMLRVYLWSCSLNFIASGYLYPQEFCWTLHPRITISQLKRTSERKVNSDLDDLRVYLLGPGKHSPPLQI